MTPAKIHAVLDAALAGITPTLPLELEDCKVLHTRIKQRLPEHSVEVWHNHASITIKVYDGGRLLASRRLIA